MKGDERGRCLAPHGHSRPPVGTPWPISELTFREEHGVQPQAGPALQAGRQLGEVVAVQVEDNLQRLPAALNVVENIGVCGETWWAGDAAVRAASEDPPSDLTDVPGPQSRSCRPPWPPALRGVPETAHRPTLRGAASDLPFTSLNRSVPTA